MTTVADQPDDDRSTADQLFATGSEQYSAGRYQQSVSAFRRAQSIFAGLGLGERVAACDQNLGIVYGAMGRYSEAEASFLRARGVFARLGLDKEVADCDLNLGNIQYATGRYEAAEVAYAAARAVFVRLGLDREVAGCDHNLGNIYHVTGREAGAAFLRARRVYVRLGLDRDVADCDQNLGGISYSMSRYPEAEAAFLQAREVFARLGVHEAVAHCDVNRGLVARQIAGQCLVGSDQWRSSLEVAVDSMVPAVMYLDAQRFQFPHAATRLAWSNSNREWIAILFELAAELGDARLIAELVESAVNSGVHTATMPTSENSGDVLDSESAAALSVGVLDAAQSGDPYPWVTTEPPGEDQTDSMVTQTLGGAARLIAGTALLMSAPPRLIMPDLNLALDPYLQYLDVRYVPVRRSSEPVRVW